MSFAFDNRDWSQPLGSPGSGDDRARRLQVPEPGVTEDQIRLWVVDVTRSIISGALGDGGNNPIQGDITKTFV